MSQSLLGSVNIYIISGNKLLLSRRQNTGWSDGLLCAPGGHTEAEETPRQAMRRELKEELNIEVAIDDLDFLGVAARKSGDRQYVAYEFVLRDKNYQPENSEPNLCSELVWVDLDNLPDDIIPDFRAVIEQCLLSDKHYLEIGY